jgi:hypothetical protein
MRSKNVRMLVSEIARGVSPLGEMSPKKMKEFGTALVAMADFLIAEDKKAKTWVGRMMPRNQDDAA